MRGSKVDPELERQFREELLVKMMPKRAGDALGIPQSTAYVLAARAHNDADFVKAWDELRAMERKFDVPMLRAMVVEAAEVVQARILEADKTPEELAEIAVANNLKSFSYQNPKPQYFRGLVQAFSELAKPRDAEGNQLPDGPAVVVNIAGEPDEGHEPQPDAA